MHTTKCPLCGAKDAKNIETINADDLVGLYVNAYKADFSYLFKQSEIQYYQCNNCDLKFFFPSVTGDENFYNILQKTDLYYVDDKEEYKIASEYITEKDDVLEIGCGKAAFSKKINCKSYTGLEFSANAKALAEQGGVHIINQTIQEHARSNANKYDVVCTFQVLEHVDCNELFAFLKAAVDCLKAGGRLIISVPSADSFLSEMANSVLNLPPHHQSHWPDKSLKKVAGIFNLDILCFKHDTIALQNKGEYLSVKLRHFLAFRHRLIEPKQNIFQKIALRILRLIPVKIQFFIIDRVKPNGHSITAVFRKIVVK
ncbi:methyltransferase [Sulfuricaulis limicola]|uniref:Methyltransferase n=1 Tax=Sulfuricaulis limicola TaxID=1620215 RepID=A0A1B4XGH8_9GAMM|nr:class I SAM-dependent methyltransferase [Sulfuricaulis limicola]BAV33914.1 methyltransferase [Sulfuricaulis limicola]